MIIERPEINPAGRYTITQAAHALGIHRNTIYNWLKSGKFHAKDYNKRKVNGKTIIYGIALLRIYSDNIY